MTWSTPVCVEIYENRYVGFENLGLELTAVKVEYFAVCLLFAHHAEKVGRTGYKHIDEYLYYRSEHSRFEGAADNG